MDHPDQRHPLASPRCGHRSPPRARRRAASPSVGVIPTDEPPLHVSHRRLRRVPLGQAMPIEAERSRIEPSRVDPTSSAPIAPGPGPARGGTRRPTRTASSRAPVERHRPGARSVSAPASACGGCSEGSSGRPPSRAPARPGSPLARCSPAGHRGRPTPGRSHGHGSDSRSR